jgi:hypothetical protein
MTVTPVANLGNIARAEYKALFDTEVAKGIREPLVLPFCLFGPFILPIVYLAIPHRNRPWLYHARWLVVAFVVAFDAYMIQYMSSYNVAPAYASGLMGGWGILTTLNLLVWSDPQLDYARVVKIPKGNKSQASSKQLSIDVANGSNQESVIRQRKAYHEAIALSGDAETRAKNGSSKDVVYAWQKFPENGSFSERLNWTLDLATNFREIGRFGTII